MGRITVAEIIRETAEYFYLRPADLTGPRRVRQIAYARFTAMAVARRLTTLSLIALGKLFGGRDHTSVMNGLRRVQRLGLLSAAADEIETRLRKRLQAGWGYRPEDNESAGGKEEGMR